MLLRRYERLKDGEEHQYWSVVERRRVAVGHIIQQTLLYLGAINDSEKAYWTRLKELQGGSYRNRAWVSAEMSAVIEFPWRVMKFPSCNS